MFKLLASASVAAVLSSAAMADTVSTLADENSSIFPWGLPNTAAYGQTFTLDAAATLESLTFRIDDGGSAIDYDLHIAAWGGSMVSGGSLYSISGSTAGVDAMTSITNSLGDTMVGAGQYVAFFQATSEGSSDWGSVSGSDPYDGGAFVFQNNTGDTSQWDTVNWTTNWQGAGSDLAFELVTGVAEVPLPASLPLLLAGFGGLAAMRRRKKA